MQHDYIQLKSCIYSCLHIRSIDAGIIAQASSYTYIIIIYTLYIYIWDSFRENVRVL